MTTDLAAFNHDLVQDVLATAEASELTLPDAFTGRMIEHLSDAGEIDEALTCYHRSRGVEVNAYGQSDDAATLDLFVTNFTNSDTVGTMAPADVQTGFTRLNAFLDQCRTGLRSQISDGLPVYDMVQDIEICLKSATRVRFFVLTNATVRATSRPPQTHDGVEFEYHVWDLARLHRLLTSGSLHEPIVVDFERRFGAGLPCLSTPQIDRDYSVLLSIIPGDVLADLYDEFGPRLLELNVRSFLQTKGAVNRGIRDSLHQTPERFLAYNNGISATASRVELSPDRTTITRLHDLQIVNGGQTTASIHNAAKRDKVDVGNVLVQAKITVVSPDKLEEIVPAISKYSNTQNRVTTADFSANDAYHVEVQKLSRSVWAPSTAGDGQETRWFYERARGQYADQLSRERTPARQKAFKLFHPTRQKFTKTDLAKFACSWNQLPFQVSRGAEKNFREFMVSLAKNRPQVDQRHFQQIVAKAILFRETERIVGSHQFGGYRANIVTYTIAKLVNATSGRLDLDSIWRQQGLTAPLRDAISDLCVPVQASIVNPPNGANVGEWCKKPEAWTRVLKIAWQPPADLTAELIDPRKADAQAAAAAAESGETHPDVARLLHVTAQTWFDCAAWAKQTGSLAPWQRALAFSVGQRVRGGQEPSVKQAVQGLKLLTEAARIGFRPTDPLPAEVRGDL